MSQKMLGTLIAVIGLIVIVVNASFYSEFVARGTELHKTCPLPPDVCPFIEPPWQGITLFVVGAFLVLLGFYVYKRWNASAEHNASTSSPVPVVDSAKIAENLAKLEGEEAQVYKIIADENGMVFQNKIIEKTGFTKVKVSRILDTLEHKGLLERRRRGMSNVVVLR